MSGGWQVGDLALCVRDGVVSTVRRGRIYTVTDVVHAREWNWLGLVVDGAVNSANLANWKGAIAELYFRKVTPPKADKFDREVIEAMSGVPILPRVPLPVDVTDADRFPEIARALAHAAALRRNAKPEGTARG